MNDFTVGSLVGCKLSSNDHYNITSERNGYIGRVVDIDMCSGFITLHTVKSNRTGLTRKEFAVDSSHFYPLGNEYTLARMKEIERI